MAVTVRQQISAKKRSTSRKLAWLIGNYILLVILAIFFLFPIVFMVVSSLKSNEEQLLSDLSSLKAFIPYGTISLGNYSGVFARLPFGQYMFNSVFIVTMIVVFGLFVNSLIAYALARMNFPGLSGADHPVYRGCLLHLPVLPVFHWHSERTRRGRAGRWCRSLPHVLATDRTAFAPGFRHRRHPPIPDAHRRLLVAVDGDHRRYLPPVDGRYAGLLRPGSSALGSYHGLRQYDYHSHTDRVPAVPAVVYAVGCFNWH